MNRGYHAEGGATMNVYHNQQGTSSSFLVNWPYLPYLDKLSIATPTVFDLLAPHFVQDALYDSAQRQEEYAIICQNETRTKILFDIRSWADSRSSADVCWLSGPAGTGKTTVAHKYYRSRIPATRTTCGNVLFLEEDGRPR